MQLTIEQLVAMEEGDIFDAGTVLDNLTDEEGMWEVLESVDTNKGKRIVFRLYYLDTFIKQIVALVKGENEVSWSN